MIDEIAIFRCFTGDTEKQRNAPTANYHERALRFHSSALIRGRMAQSNNLLA